MRVEPQVCTLIGVEPGEWEMEGITYTTHKHRCNTAEMENKTRDKKKRGGEKRTHGGMGVGGQQMVQRAPGKLMYYYI